ncbi:MAG: metallophosphoesterase family protein, partial [Thermomicrobiales bacterium]
MSRRWPGILLGQRDPAPEGFGVGKMRLSIALFALLTLLVGSSAELRTSHAQSADPTISLSTSSGVPGDAIVAVGSNFAPSEYGTLTWLPSGELLTKLKTRPDGGFHRRFLIPDVPTGDYIVLAQLGTQTAQASIHVDAVLLPTDTPVPTDTAVPPPAATGTTNPTNTPTVKPTATPTRTPTPTPTATQGTGPDAVLLAAGDIASCSSSGDEATANLLDGLKGTVATLGDNVYENGSVTDFANCYDPTWGRAKARTKPAPGNHDYNTPGAAGYFAYFGTAAGSPTTGYYSYDLGTWHVIVLNSNISMANGSAQENWLTSDLNAHPADCTLAYWHHPRYSSGAEHGSDPMSQAMWQDLYDAGAEIVLSGHDHDYERFAPMDASGAADQANGIREFVVGTGG